MHKGKIKPADLNQELISKTYQDLAEGAKKGYGSDWAKFPADGKGSLPTELKKNIYTFSGAKTFAQLEKLNQFLYDNDGKLRPFNEYSQLARSVNRQYNMNYLQAEWQTARTAAQMAQKWEKLQETKDIFPNLKYRSVGDDRVRPEHQRFNGIIKPIDDAFWDRYYPPLDWRCRCDVVATAEDATDDKIEDLPKPNFQGNVAKDEEIFTSKGTFFKLLNTDANAVRNLEFAKQIAPREVTHTSKKGKKLSESIFADTSGLTENRESAILVVDALNYNMTIEPHLNGRIVIGHKNAEYTVNTKKADLKTPEGLSYKNILRKAAAQECEYVIVNLTKNIDAVEGARKGIRNILKLKGVHPTIKEVIIISVEKKVTTYKRDEI